VTVDCFVVEAGGEGLAVESGRQRVLDVVASHAAQVVGWFALVPGTWHDRRVDEVTRLALQARDGDELALEGFVRRTQAPVWRLAAHLVDRASADDLTQETFLRAVPALARYRAEAPALVWLLSIARRTCADELRRRTRRRARLGRVVSLEGLEGFEPAGASDDTAMADLLDVVEGLDTDRRTAFVLTQVLGLSYEEAAQVCAVPIGTIRSRVARARADLMRAAATG
jgi:RNA polymerase sigma-70 factor (ECF subfamily)